MYFHAFTGCDVVSSFHGKGKKSAWLTWEVCGEVSETFTKLSNCPTEVSQDDMQKLENVVVLIDRVLLAVLMRQGWISLPESRGPMMRSHQPVWPSKSMQSVLPTRLGYSGAKQQCPIQNPSVLLNGETCQICWTTLSPVAASCQELTKCACKKGCNRRRKCSRSGLSCTTLCSCGCQL